MTGLMTGCQAFAHCQAQQSETLNFELQSMRTRGYIPQVLQACPGIAGGPLPAELLRCVLGAVGV